MTLKDLIAWLKDAPKRTQSISFTLLLDRDCWGNPVTVTHCKGLLAVALGPFEVEIGG